MRVSGCFAFIAAINLIAGCQTGPATEVQMANFATTCQSYGFRPGSEAYAGCMMQLDQGRVDQAVSRRRAFAAALAQAGRNMQQDAYNQQAIAAANRPINCNSQTYGTITGRVDGVRTTCY